MATEYDAYDDGLQAWLTGNPGWPGGPPARPAPTGQHVAVLHAGSHLHDLARRLAHEAGGNATAADAARADELLAAVMQELTA